LESSTKNIIYVTIGAILLIGIASFILIKKASKNSPIILLGGLDNRSGDKSIQEQVELLRSGLTNQKRELIGFRYNNPDGLIEELSQVSKDSYVVLFSAGCSKSLQIAKAMKDLKMNLDKLYIVEPYGVSSNVQKSVQGAINIGVPSKNVIVGGSTATGKGIAKNVTKTPSCLPNHWCSLTEVAKIISK
jgi:hypothetical protein